MAKKRQRLFYKRSKKFEKFLQKKWREKSVLLYFWSKSVDLYDFRVDRLWYKLYLGGQIILSTYVYIQKGLPRNVSFLTQ